MFTHNATQGSEVETLHSFTTAANSRSFGRFIGFIDTKENAEYQPTYTLKENLSLQYFNTIVDVLSTQINIREDKVSDFPHSCWC